MSSDSAVDPIKFSLFANAQSADPRLVETDWPTFVRETLEHGHTVAERDDKAAKLACPMFSPAIFSGRRATATATSVYFGVLDLDHLTEDELLAFLDHNEGLELLLYSSWSHSPENVSVRAMFPLSRPVDAKEWALFWPRMNRGMGNFGDAQCRNIDRAYFLPAIFRGRLEHAFIEHIPGDALDVDAVMGLDLPAQDIAAVEATQPVSAEELRAFAAKASEKVKGPLRRVLQGEPWAEPGARDVALFSMCGALARAFPHADAAALASHFTRSCSRWDDFPVSVVEEKIARLQGQQIEKLREARHASMESTRSTLRGVIGRDAPYTLAEVDGFARALGCTPAELRKRWIVQRAGSYYFLVGLPTPHYVGPFGKDDGRLAAATYLAPATNAGVVLLDVNGVARSAADLSMDYGTIARAVVADMTIQHTHYDASSGAIVEATCPRRDLAATYHPEIAEWLDLLGGPILVEWISWLLDLDKACAALYIEGKPGAGKSLLAKGLARLWTREAPTEMAQAMGGYNAALASCPLVFADETTPKDFRGKGRTAELRAFIQAESRPFTRKYLPDASLRGAARVVIAANNHTLLDGEENLTPNDLEAIVGRFVHIDARDASVQYLKATDTTGWVSQDKIAEHALWIIANTAHAKNPPRFLVQQAASALHRSMSTGTRMGSAVAHWLVSFVLAPETLRNGRPAHSSAHLIRGKEGKLWVSTRALIDYWGVYKTNVREDAATAKAVMLGLRGISPTTHTSRRTIRVNGFSEKSPPKFYEIRTEDLMEWCDQTGFTSREELQAALDALVARDESPAGAKPAPHVTGAEHLRLVP